MTSRFLKRYILLSDDHKFIGRIYDLSIVELHFDSYSDLSKHADCKYAYDVSQCLSTLTRRVESLNMIGSMLWPEEMPRHFKKFPVSRYEWLNISADVFLARFISVVDCAIILVNEVFECGLSAESCTIHNLKMKSVPQTIIAHLEEMVRDQGFLRKERNSRFHHGRERQFSTNDQVLKIGALYEHLGREMVDPHGQKLPLQRLFREGLVELQKEFNLVMRKTVKQLSALYDMLCPQFESRFSPKFQAGVFARRKGI